MFAEVNHRNGVGLVFQNAVVLADGTGRRDWVFTVGDDVAPPRQQRADTARSLVPGLTRTLVAPGVRRPRLGAEREVCPYGTSLAWSHS
jgi:hypothetical protein